MTTSGTPTPAKHSPASVTVDELAAGIRALEGSDRDKLLRQFEETRWARMGRTLRRASNAFWSVVQHPRVAALFTLGGLAIGLYSYRDAANQLETLEQISGGISTTYIGKFPNNMDDIIQLIKDTDPEGRIVMAVDNVGYGLFTNPAGHRKFDEGIRSALERGIEIQVVSYDDDFNREKRKEQFKTEVENKEALRELQADHATTIADIEKRVKSSGRETTFETMEGAERFLQLLWEAEEGFRAVYGGLRNIAICKIGKNVASSPYANDPLEINFWASVDPSGDWKRVIFAFKIYPANPNESATEATFTTRDGEFMKVLRGRWERWGEACKTDFGTPSG